MRVVRSISRRKDDRKNPGKDFPGVLCCVLLCLLLLLPAITVKAAFAARPSNVEEVAFEQAASATDDPFFDSWPVLRILYTANTHGVLYPCPS